MKKYTLDLEPLVITTEFSTVMLSTKRSVGVSSVSVQGLLDMSDEAAARVMTWIEALESGKYQQTRGMLRTKDEVTGQLQYCCLGVACEISKLGTFVESPPPIVTDEGAHKFIVNPQSYSDSQLPHEVSGYFGLDDINGLAFDVYNEENGLIDYEQDMTVLNDDHGFNFRQIAIALRHALDVRVILHKQFNG